MRIALTLFRRFGLFAHRAAHVDACFDRRLQRLGAREASRPLRAAMFRNRDAHPEA